MVKDQDKSSDAAYKSLIYNITGQVLNSISLFSAFLVISTILYLRISNKASINRVSLRLQAYVSTADMFFAIFQIMTVHSHPPVNVMCKISSWGFIFTALFGCFLTVAIAFNLQIIFVYNYLSTQRFEKFYMVVPLILSLFLSTLPVAFDAIGFDEKEFSCWYKNGYTTRAIVWEFTTLHGWIIGSVIYCIFSVCLIINRLLESNKNFLEVNRTETNVPKLSHPYQKSRRRQLMINQAVKRIVLYPTVPIITYTFNIVSTLTFFITKENYFNLQMLANICTSSQGLLNSLVFCFDPVMRQIWYKIFNPILKFFNIGCDHEEDDDNCCNDNNCCNNDTVVNDDETNDYRDSETISQGTSTSDDEVFSLL